MLTSTLNRGFQMEFKNGVSISVQWGHGNYCSNRDLDLGYFESMKPEHAMGFKAKTAEVLIEHGEKNITDEFAEFIDKRSDGIVIGWLTADEVAEAINWAKTKEFQ